MNKNIKYLVENIDLITEDQITSVLDLLLDETNFISETDIIGNTEIDKLEISKSNDNQYIILHKIIMKHKGKGYGSEILQIICDWCDLNNFILCLTPDTTFGATNVNRLKRFYKKFGFIENKGRYRDFKIKESLYRLPLSNLKL